MATNTVNPKTKNTMPAFSRGTLEHLQKGLANGVIAPPAFHFLTEDTKKCLAFVDIDGTIYQINLERIEKIEAQLADLKDPETGEVVPIKEYVEKNKEESNAYTDEKVSVVQQSITMITSIGGDS